MLATRILTQNNRYSVSMVSDSVISSIPKMRKNSKIYGGVAV